MVEPKKPLKKKDQIIFDKEVAQKLQAQLDVELEEEEKLTRKRKEDANIAEWDNVQAMMDANYELAARLQAEEQGELTIKEKSRLFVELMNKRKKNFIRLRAEEQRIKPPTKAQKRNTMSTYLNNMAVYKHNQLKIKSFEDIQMLFDKEMKILNTFVDMDTELVKGSETRTEGSSKRVGEELESKNLKKQKLYENVEAEVDDEAEMKKHMEIVPDDEVAIDAIPLATKPPIIVLKDKERPYPSCTHCGFNDHRPDDCRNYPECAICSSKSSIGVTYTSCRSNVHSTTNHNDFEHFKRETHREPIWYLDSGYSRSMTGVKSYLHKYVEKLSPKVVFGDNSSCIIKGYDSINCGALRRNDVYVLGMSSLTSNGAYFFAKASESVN
ncbi:hypothetical protein Tco_0431522 [Tanacetum coccineum]